MHQIDLFADLGQHQCIFGSRVAAACDNDGLAAEEHAVAGCAVGDTAAAQSILVRNTQRTGRSAGCQNDRSAKYLARAGGDALGLRGQVECGHFCVLGLSAKALGTALHLFCQFKTVNALVKTGVVVYLGRSCHLSASGQFFQYQRAQAGADTVECCGVAAGAAADDDNVIGRMLHGINPPVQPRCAAIQSSSCAWEPGAISLSPCAPFWNR